MIFNFMLFYFQLFVNFKYNVEVYFILHYLMKEFSDSVFFKWFCFVIFSYDFVLLFSVTILYHFGFHLVSDTVFYSLIYFEFFKYLVFIIQSIEFISVILYFWCLGSLLELMFLFCVNCLQLFQKCNQILQCNQKYTKIIYDF